MLENGKYGEYTDLYDENKNLTGEKLFREKGTKLIVPKGRYSIVVLAFIENSKGEFLFQMTSKRKKNVWATTGGHVKSGQTSKEAIIEEIKEELGIDINEDEVKLFKTYKYETWGVYNDSISGFLWYDYIYFCKTEKFKWHGSEDYLKKLKLI